ncbi:PREDICTED: mitogen-activated protein kinase kinase kinase 14-like [Acropora digitifera]|uniref:mitogen-activated protein kinase kinase kinase 14-like n=1 Tax=Acropora digitifera TaxID=70779 RepID=UPI00077A145B|nr:PREDICTED: mitogen-activated protein kinase kinase kinase 14-like [Acropora digitifera]
MSLQPSNTKNEDAVQNMPDTSVADSENNTHTRDNTTDRQIVTGEDQQLLKTSPREEQADYDHNATSTGDRKTSESTIAGSEVESVVGATLPDELEQLLPNPPSSSPKDIRDGETTAMSTTSEAGSGASSLSQDSYMWSLTSSSLPPPNSLSDDEERIIYPLEETFAIQDNKFEEGDQYDVIEEIGSGAFGKCYVASKSSDPTLFCIKKCPYKVNELLALSLAKKENVMEIVGYYGAKLKGRNAYICMEFMTGGTILELVQRQTPFRAGAWPIIREETCFPLVKDVLKGEEFLNNNGLVHGDIKADNILLLENCTHAKLTDFGSAKNIQEAGGSFEDIWKTGCLLLFMLNGKISPLFGVTGVGYERQRSVNPEEHFPSQEKVKAKGETMELLKMFFGVNREYLPNATEILRVASVFQEN